MGHLRGCITAYPWFGFFSLCSISELYSIEEIVPFLLLYIYIYIYIFLHPSNAHASAKQILNVNL